VLFIGAHLRPAARQPAALRTLQVTSFRLSSGLPGCPKTDLCINLQSKSSWNALGAQIANLGPGAVEAVLARAGHADVEGLPSAGRIQFRARRARPRAAEARLPLRGRAARLRSMRALTGRPFPVRFTDRLRRLNQKTAANAWKTALSQGCSISVRLISDYGLAQLTGDAVALEDLVADD
jgi:5-(hydroxymethyl)furfural/furfural oxidase